MIAFLGVSPIILDFRCRLVRLLLSHYLSSMRGGLCLDFLVQVKGIFQSVENASSMLMGANPRLDLHSSPGWEIE